MAFLRALNQMSAIVQKVSHYAWIISGASMLAFMLLSSYVSDTGGPTFRWLLAWSGEGSWPSAASLGAFTIFVYAVIVAVGLRVFRYVLRRILLLSADPVTGIVVIARQTGMMVNNSPVMAIQVRIDTPTGPLVTTARKLLDLGSIPRPGDRVRLDVSRIDPSCATYRGLA